MDSKIATKEVTEIQNYIIVEAKSASELVKLTNLKTKLGWKCLGGMCHLGNSSNVYFPFCQSMYRMEKPSTEKPVRNYTSYQYQSRENVTLPEDMIESSVKQPLLGTPKVKSKTQKSVDKASFDIRDLAALKNNMGNSILEPIKIRSCINKNIPLSKTSAAPRMKKKNHLKKSSTHPLKKTK